jgi:hypothetical protein
MNNCSHIIPIIITALIVCGAWIGYVQIVLDPQREQSAKAFEQCVLEQYDMHPVAYYQMSGSYPVCVTK